MKRADETRAHGYAPSRDDLLNRLRRIRGQVSGVERMVEDDRYCIEILTQIAAIRAALDKVALGLLDAHVRNCVIGGHPERQEERTGELMAAVTRFMRT